jgi:hypothetical protein
MFKRHQHYKESANLYLRSPIRVRNQIRETAVTNARFAALHGLPVRPVTLSTTPVPLRKPRARHKRHSFK